jgi:tetratricopeptide (TPR) repeat protein
MRKALLTAMMLAGASPVATAQPAPARPITTQQQVDEYAAAATTALRNGDHDTAIDLYRKANALDPSPELLYDLAQAYRKKAESLRGSSPLNAAAARDQARDYYRKFLDTHPTNDEAELRARGLLGRLDEWWKTESPNEEAARRAAEDARREEATRIEQARLAEERRKQAERDAIENTRVSLAVTSTKVANDRSKARVIKISGGAAIGAGLIGLGVGTYYGIKARGLSNDLSSADVYDTTRIAKGQQAAKLMVIGCTAGAALVVGGAFTYWIGRGYQQRAEHAPSVSVTVAPTGQGARVFAWGAF